MLSPLFFQFSVPANQVILDAGELHHPKMGVNQDKWMIWLNANGVTLCVVRVLNVKDRLEKIPDSNLMHRFASRRIWISLPAIAMK